MISTQFLTILAVTSLSARHRSYCADGSPSTLQGRDEWDLNRLLVLRRGLESDQVICRSAEDSFAVDRYPGVFTAQYLHWASTARFESDMDLARA